jgi:hypothetical protein
VLLLLLGLRNRRQLLHGDHLMLPFASLWGSSQGRNAPLYLLLLLLLLHLA